MLLAACNLDQGKPWGKSWKALVLVARSRDFLGRWQPIPAIPGSSCEITPWLHWSSQSRPRKCWERWHSDLMGLTGYACWMMNPEECFWDGLKPPSSYCCFCFPWNMLFFPRSPLNHHFPMVFLWFSYGFPMVFLWFSYGFPVTNPRQCENHHAHLGDTEASHWLYLCWHARCTLIATQQRLSN